MGQESMRSRKTELPMLKSRLYEPNTGRCYAGFRQTLLHKRLTVAYITSTKVPEYGGTLVNRQTGEQYEVKNVIHLRRGEIIDSYELVLSHL